MPHNPGRTQRQRINSLQAPPGSVWLARCRGCGHVGALPVALLRRRFGDLYPVEVACMSLRCTGCDQQGVVTAELARLCQSGCRWSRG